MAIVVYQRRLRLRRAVSAATATGSDDVCERWAAWRSAAQPCAPAPLAHSADMARPRQSPRHAAQYENLPPRGPGIPIT